MPKHQLLITLGLVLVTPVAGANPAGAEVVAGSATFSQPDANVLNVTNTNNTIINWQSFDIGVGQTTNFIQPNSSSAVLNQVISNNPSQILGNLTSNGQVYLVNQYGLLIGEGAQINTAGFFGSTLNITDEDFLSGNLSFSGGGGGDIENQGYIYAGEGGNVVLIAPNITNGGVIEVDQGNIILAAGESITLTSLDNSAIRFDVQSADNTVTNLGSIIANNGAASLFAGTLTHSGSISATGLVQNGDGTISLVATNDIQVTDLATLTADGETGGQITVQSQQGDLYFSGSASARGESEAGGTITLLGDRVGLFGAASVDASGATGGGEVLIGGDYQGQGETQTSRQTLVSADAVIRADAIESGNGGKVIVWSDEYTQFNGAASATGGANAGDGGFIEISGKENLSFDGYVDTSAPNGLAGTVLFDPKNITISNTGGDVYDPLIAPDAFADLPADPTVTFSATSLATMLGMQNVILQANNDIFVLDDIIVSDLVNDFDLTLRAGRSIDIQAYIFTDNGNFTLIANDAGAILANRDPGTAQITMASSKFLDMGTGNLAITMDVGSGPGSNGDITLASFRAADFRVSNSNTGTVLTTAGITTFQSGAVSNVNWINSGILEWESLLGTSSFSTSNTNILNTGIFSIAVKGAGGQTVTLNDTASSFTNQGLLITSSLVGTDTVDLSLPFFNQAGAIAINSGSLRLGGATLTLDAGSSLQGDGTFIGSVVNDAGIVTAGVAFDFAGAFSTGTLTITGNYTQNANGQLLIKLDTTVTGLQSDVFNIGGTFTAGGDIAFIPINNATALEIVLMVGQTFEPFFPLPGGGFTGAFSSLTIPPGMGVTVDALGAFTIVATSETLSQLSAELDRLIEEGEFSVEEYFYQLALLQQLVIDNREAQQKLALSRLICK